MANEHHAHGEQTQHPEWPATVDEAVDRLVAMLSEQNKQAIRGADSVFLFHFTLGMWIRNTFGLWGGNDALLHSCALWRRGSDNPNTPPMIHPDDASTVILEALLEALQERLEEEQNWPYVVASYTRHTGGE